MKDKSIYKQLVRSSRNFNKKIEFVDFDKDNDIVYYPYEDLFSN